ncbi:MAG: M14 family metallopeptidase [Croceitalea sp.]|nr:M14 family metallopeptidase [Croceitalea sp.]
MRNYFFFFIFLVLLSCKTEEQKPQPVFKTVFETSNGQQTATYEEVIEFYLKLAKNTPEINVQTIGETDSGKPLHLVTYNADGIFNFQKLGADKLVVLINNGIHPGESDGIDATMLLFRDLASNFLKGPKNIVVVTIPVYNVGGMLDRNSWTRANQNGPKAYGFRGNSQNYDLNRDFIKSDTKNASTFSTIFHLTQPDLFIDNHVSNGANYQYTLTHLFTQHNKLGGSLGTYLNEEMMPGLTEELGKANWDITPYVNVFNRPPETGFDQFLDHPRYSTGYTTLWNTLGMMVETHMLKPYKQRVLGTYQVLSSMLNIAARDRKKIKDLRNRALTNINAMKEYYLNWQIDTTKSKTIYFKGFKADTVISQVTGFERIKYDENIPIEKEVIYKNQYYPKDTVVIPAAYIIKKGWWRVKEHLEQNKIQFHLLDKDSTLLVESYRISDYNTSNRPYEGHYPHYGTLVNVSTKLMQFEKGDLVVPTNQKGIRYLLETLEPTATDSFFNWNFFDSILQQKEGFSPYVFEDEALKLLENDSLLRQKFSQKKMAEPQFEQNWYAQLDWLFKQSKYYESAHMQYPVFRIMRGSETENILSNYQSSKSN